MLGWHVSVYRKLGVRDEPATFESQVGVLLAQWQGGLGALAWLDELVRSGEAIDLGGDGYPMRYTVRCHVVRPTVLGGPPEARDAWVFGGDDVIDWSVWKGRTHVAEDELATVPAGEWLIVEAWDES